MNGPQTYNNARLDEKARSVFYKAMHLAERMLDGHDALNPEKLHALAAAADAAACGFESESDAEAFA